MNCIASGDFFVVPTVTFKVLFVLVVLSHARRHVVPFDVTTNPTAEWTAQQITKAFPWEEAPRYLVHDRDRSYGHAFRRRIIAMGISEIMTAPRPPWQNGYVERLIRSVHRERSRPRDRL